MNAIIPKVGELYLSETVERKLHVKRFSLYM